MNKVSSTIKDFVPLFLLVFVLVLIFVPLPIMLIQVLIIFNFGFSICLFLAKYLSKTMLAFHFPRLVSYYCVFSFGLIIATTRTFLAISSLEGQIPIVLIIGQWICRENYICGFFSTFMLCISLLVFCKQHVKRSQEDAANFCLERMNQELFDINQQVARKEITEEEGEVLKEKVQSKTKHYTSMDGSAKLLLATIRIFILLYIIAVSGGVAIGILDRNMYWKDALDQYVMLSSGYLLLFVIPVFLTSLGFKTTIVL